MVPRPEIVISLADGVRILKFNRPHKKNALTFSMYKTIIDILNGDADNDRVILTIITGVGDYYSSGVDLKAKHFSSSSQKQAQKKSLLLQLVEAFIRYPKLLIAVVNGPAIGIAATTLALCDVVFASDRATFSTPFLKFSMPPEGCSSYMFPRTMGKSRAMEMLVLGRILTAEEALQAKFISKIIPHEQLEDKITELTDYGKLINISSITNCKKLMNDTLKNTLLDVNLTEETAMEESNATGAVTRSIQTFLKKKSKL